MPAESASGFKPFSLALHMPATHRAVVWHGPGQACHTRNSDCTRPSVWRKGWPNRHLMVMQNWGAASENFWQRPCLPDGGASHCMSKSRQMLRSPRALNAALYAFQLVVQICADPSSSHPSHLPTLAEDGICATRPIRSINARRF